MLKKKTKVKQICEDFGPNFRAIHHVQAAFDSRHLPDEALCALLWEYKDRGKKGYDMTDQFFSLFRTQFPELRIDGPQRAGKDLRLGDFLVDFPNPARPVDFVVKDTNEDVLAIGLVRYDSDRGGAQEDDRIGGYRNCADEIVTYAQRLYLRTNVLFINDGPGLLLGSMWRDYAEIERRWVGRIMVLTLRMVPERLTLDWLRS